MSSEWLKDMKTESAINKDQEELLRMYTYVCFDAPTAGHASRRFHSKSNRLDQKGPGGAELPG